MMRVRILARAKRAFAALCALGWATAVLGGPVVLGGDDLNDHGSFNGTANLQGWLYIQNALQNLISGSTRPGNTGRIAVLGSAPSTSMSGDGCGAAVFPAQVLGRQVDCIDTATGINTFFANLAAGTVNPIVIVIPGNGVSNALDPAEEAALATNAAALNAYVASGGGLLAHTGEYTWLAALVPGLLINPACDSSTAVLTPAGTAAFPTVTNADIRAGPCHNTFTGNFGGLSVLATDTAGLALMIGGGGGTTITPTASGPVEVPTMSEWTMLLMALLIAGSAVITLRRR